MHEANSITRDQEVDALKNARREGGTMVDVVDGIEWFWNNGKHGEHWALELEDAVRRRDKIAIGNLIDYAIDRYWRSIADDKVY